MSSWWKEFFANKLEIIFGAVCGILSCIVYNLWGLVYIIPFMFLYRLGGTSVGHWVRVWIMPGLVIIPMLKMLNFECAFYYFLTALIYSLGTGENTWLYKLSLKLSNEGDAPVLVRMFLTILLALVLLLL